MTDYVVVLCGGEFTFRDAWRTTARIEAGCSLAEASDCSLLISSGVSGHRLKAGKRPVWPESWAYAQIAVNHFGFVSQNISLEDVSRDTVGNVLFSLLGLKSLNLPPDASVVWVTNTFHTSRLAEIIRYFEEALSAKFQSSVFEVSDAEKLSTDPEGYQRLLDEEAHSLEAFRESFSGEAKISGVLDTLLTSHPFYSVKSWDAVFND